MHVPQVKSIRIEQQTKETLDSSLKHLLEILKTEDYDYKELVSLARTLQGISQKINYGVGVARVELPENGLTFSLNASHILGYRNVARDDLINSIRRPTSNYLLMAREKDFVIAKSFFYFSGHYYALFELVENQWDERNYSLSLLSTQRANGYTVTEAWLPFHKIIPFFHLKLGGKLEKPEILPADVKLKYSKEFD